MPRDQEQLNGVRLCDKSNGLTGVAFGLTKARDCARRPVLKKMLDLGVMNKHHLVVLGLGGPQKYHLTRRVSSDSVPITLWMHMGFP